MSNAIQDGIVINDVAVQVPGFPCVSYLSDPAMRLRIGADGRKRREGAPTLAVFHTTRGKWPQKILPGYGAPGQYAENNARYWSRSPKAAGAHILVDFDGTGVCTADLWDEVAYGSGRTNGDGQMHDGVLSASVQIEVCQGEDGELYEGQIDAFVSLAGFLIDTFAIVPRVVYPYTRAVPFFKAGAAGWSGFVDHRTCSDGRGKGDAGEAIPLALIRGNKHCKPLKVVPPTSFV